MTTHTWEHSNRRDGQSVRPDEPEYDRLSILYNDAVKALAEAEAILEAAGGRAGLSVATGAAATVCEYLCDEIERYAPHSVKT